LVGDKNMTTTIVLLKPLLNGIQNSAVTVEFQEIKPGKLISIENDLQKHSINSVKSKNSYRYLHALIPRLEIYKSFSAFTFTPDIMLTEHIAESMK
jgi:hypothetical protein